MTLDRVLDEVKDELTGGLLELEIDDSNLIKAINQALRELERYWDETTMITVPYSSCIDTAGFDSSSIVKVYRTQGIGDSSNSNGTGLIDPMYYQQWMIFSNAGTMYNLQDYVLNYAAWTSMNQIKNTVSTDLGFKEDKHNHKLYINNYLTTPEAITIEYIPKLNSVEDIKSDYWIDILIRLSIANAKIRLGRIRTRFTLANSPWPMDGDTLLEEGKSEREALREVLRTNSNLIFPVD